jgi:hypothetical protein
MQDRELLFQMLASKDWDGLSELIYEHRAVLTSDPVIKHAVTLFESEFIDHIKVLPASDQLKKLRHITLLIESGESSFAAEFVGQAIDAKLRALYEIRSPAFVGYASKYGFRPVARTLLEQTRVERPEHFAEAKRPAVSVKAVSTKSANSCVASLFKSSQELNFYLAFRSVFPHLLACPNLPASTILRFDFIRDNLDSDAREYFFKAVFDCVAVDPAEDYRPNYFFELDSKYHDSAVAKRNDQLKDAICNAAGVKLTRIRAFDVNETSEGAFSDLIRDLIPKRSASIGT